MKKVISILVALVLIFLFASCKQPASQEQTSQLPNPIVEVTGSEDFAPLGVSITAPEGAENVTYSIIADVTAQINFTLEGRAYTYRAAKTTDDISGVYETFDETQETFDLDAADFSVSVLVRTISGGADGALATWSLDEVSYSLYSADDSTIDTMSDTALLCAYADLPFGACIG
jgi:hypothetical protein